MIEKIEWMRRTSIGAEETQADAFSEGGLEGEEEDGNMSERTSWKRKVMGREEHGRKNGGQGERKE